MSPTADRDEVTNSFEGETSSASANDKFRQNKKGKPTRSPEVIGSATDVEGSQKVETSHVATRSSTRQVKKAKRERSPTTPLTKSKLGKGVNTPDAAKNLPAKGRRPWELWTANDKKLFFEGLFQYGKDFDAIQDFIQKKVGKKTQPHLIKNKDQVRYFYYRTWNKIQKFVEIDDNVEKSTQELYGLINFGELRKRVGAGLKLDQKNGQKFRELVHNGLTTIKFRGKNYRLRTPVCRALKVLNKVGEGEKEERLRLPGSLTFELRPKNNEAWSYVQSCSHNPHVKMAIKPSRQLSTIFTFLEKKWKTADEKLRDQLKIAVKAEKELRISIPKSSKSYPVTFKTADAQPRLGVTLENYKENCKGLIDSPTQKTDDTLTHDENAIDGTNIFCEKADDSPDMDIDDDDECEETETSNTILREKQTLSKLPSDGTVNVESTKSSPRTANKINSDLNKDDIDEGWTSESVKTLTIGEIYLMLGRPSRMILEYEWCDIKVDHFHLLTLNNMLRRLVHLASSQLMDVNRKPASPVRCTCKCGKVGTPSTNKSPGSSRSPAVAKDPSTPRGRRIQPSPVAAKTAKEDPVFIVPASVPPKTAVSPRPGEPVKPLDGTHFLQQLDSLKPQKHKMRNRMNRRPFLVQRRLLPKAQTVAVAMFPNGPVSTIRPGFVPVVPGQTSQSPGGVTRTVISPVTVMSPTNLVSQGSDMTNIISAAACQSGIHSAKTPPKMISLQTSTVLSSTSPTTTTAPPIKIPRRITPIPVFEDGNNSIPNPTSPFASIAAQQMSSPLAGTSLVNNSPTPGPMGDMQVSDVLHQLASQVDPDMRSCAPTLTTPSLKSSLLEPPSISSLLDFSLPATDLSESTDKLLDSFCGLLDSSGIVKSSRVPTQVTSSGLNTSPTLSPNRSPMKNISDPQLSSWFTNDEFSLSSFLLDSPQKKPSEPPTSSSSTGRLPFSEQSLDVDTHFQNMMNENSVDFSSKFADIAAQMSATKD